MMERKAFKMFLKPDYQQAYEKRHAAIWHELKRLLSDNGIRDYSIYWDKESNVLFAFQIIRGNKSSQELSDNLIIKKWWNYMADTRLKQ